MASEIQNALETTYCIRLENKDIMNLNINKIKSLSASKIDEHKSDSDRHEVQSASVNTGITHDEDIKTKQQSTTIISENKKECINTSNGMYEVEYYGVDENSSDKDEDSCQVKYNEGGETNLHVQEKHDGIDDDSNPNENGFDANGIDVLDNQEIGMECKVHDLAACITKCGKQGVDCHTVIFCPSIAGI